jgi:hypothetical protein
LVFDGKRISRSLNILDIELGGFSYILECFLAGITLRNATGQAGDYGDIASITLTLKDDCVTHPRLLGEPIPWYARSLEA